MVVAASTALCGGSYGQLTPRVVEVALGNEQFFELTAHVCVAACRSLFDATQKPVYEALVSDMQRLLSLMLCPVKLCVWLGAVTYPMIKFTEATLTDCLTTRDVAALTATLSTCDAITAFARQREIEHVTLRSADVHTACILILVAAAAKHAFPSHTHVCSDCGKPASRCEHCRNVLCDSCHWQKFSDGGCHAISLLSVLGRGSESFHFRPLLTEWLNNVSPSPQARRTNPTFRHVGSAITHDQWLVMLRLAAEHVLRAVVSKEHCADAEWSVEFRKGYVSMFPSREAARASGMQLLNSLPPPVPSLFIPRVKLADMCVLLANRDDAFKSIRVRYLGRHDRGRSATDNINAELRRVGESEKGCLEVQQMKVSNTVYWKLKGVE